MLEDMNKPQELFELLIASKCGDVQVVVELLAGGADVNSKAKNGVTALILAADKGHVDVISMLLENGADPNAQDRNGVTATMIAEYHGYSNVADIINDFAG